MHSRSLPAILSSIILLCASAPAPGQEIAFDLDPARTTVQFTLGGTLHTVHGSFKLKQAPSASIRPRARSAARLW